MGVFLALTPWAGAQTTDPATKELIERLLSRIDTLEKRVAQLENSKTQAVAPATPSRSSASRSAPAQTAHEHDTPPPVDADQPLISHAQSRRVQRFQLRRHRPERTLRRIRHADDAGPAHRVSGRSVRAAHELCPVVQSERVRGTQPDGALRCGHRDARPLPGFNIELERLIIRYDLNDYFKVSFGRYHTPINYWNTAYHHGAWLQTSHQPAGDDAVRRQFHSGPLRRHVGGRRGAGGCAWSELTPAIGLSAGRGAPPARAG